MCMFCCYTRLINGTNARIELAENFLFSHPGRHGCIIELPPSGRCYHPAAIFSSRNRHAGRPSIISIRVNGVEAPRTLSPEHFKTYIRLRFVVDRDGVLQIRGVKAIFSDHLQLWNHKSGDEKETSFGRWSREPKEILRCRCVGTADSVGSLSVILTHRHLRISGDGDFSAGVSSDGLRSLLTVE